MGEEFVDFHCHLEHPLLSGALDGVVKRAASAGVVKSVSAGSGRESNRAQLSIKQRFGKEVEVVLGVAPPNALACNLQQELSFIRENAGAICGIGEIGLDLHHLGPETLVRQKEVLCAQLELAEELSLPVVLHTRKAEEEVLGVLEGFPSVKAMLHFFLLPKLAQVAAGKGILVSLPTIKSSSKAKIAGEVPLELLGCETDSPYGLGGGVTSEPKDVVAAYAEIASARQVGLEEVCGKVRENAFRLFGWG